MQKKIKVRYLSRKSQSLKRLLYLSGISLFLMSASGGGCGPECPHNDGNYLEIGFFDKNNPTQSLYQAPYNRLYLAELDTTIVSSYGNYYGLGIDVTRQQMTAVFINDTANVQDTVIFRYKSQVQYLDNECGMQFEVKDMQATSRSFNDSIMVDDAKLNTWYVRLYK